MNTNTTATETAKFDLNGVKISNGKLYFLSEIHSNGREGNVYTSFWDATNKEVVTYCLTKHPDYAPSVYCHINFINRYDKKLIADELNAYLESELNRKAQIEIAKYNEAISKYNSILIPQKFGQSIEVISGKHRGFKGIIFWEGNDKFKNNNYDYSSKQKFGIAVMDFALDYVYNLPKLKDIIGIKDEKGKVIFVKKDYCKVTNGFISATLPDISEIKNRIRINEENFNTWLKMW